MIMIGLIVYASNDNGNCNDDVLGTFNKVVISIWQ